MAEPSSIDLTLASALDAMVLEPASATRPGRYVIRFDWEERVCQASEHSQPEQPAVLFMGVDPSFGRTPYAITVCYYSNNTNQAIKLLWASHEHSHSDSGIQRALQVILHIRCTTPLFATVPIVVAIEDAPGLPGSLFDWLLAERLKDPVTAPFFQGIYSIKSTRHGGAVSSGVRLSKHGRILMLDNFLMTLTSHAVIRSDWAMAPYGEFIRQLYGVMIDIGPDGIFEVRFPPGEPEFLIHSFLLALWGKRLFYETQTEECCAFKRRHGL